MTEKRSFIADIRLAAKKYFSNGKEDHEIPLAPENEPQTSLAEELMGIDFEQPDQALKIIDKVLDRVSSETRARSLTTQEVDLAMGQIAVLAKKVTKQVRRETKEAVSAESQLNIADKIKSFFGGSNDKIAVARKERKQADRAKKLQENTKQSDSQFDEAIDELIIREVAKAESKFKNLIELQNKLVDLIDAGEAVISNASSLETAALVDGTVNIDLGSDVLNAAVEMGQNLQVTSANSSLENSLSKFSNQLNRYENWVKDLEWSPNFLLQINNMTDVTWHIIGNDSMSAVSHIMDLIGGLSAMSEASTIKNKTQSVVDDLYRELKTTEKAITRVIETIREDLQLG